MDFFGVGGILSILEIRHQVFIFLVPSVSHCCDPSKEKKKTPQKTQGMTWRSSAKLGKVGLFIRERGVVQNHLPFSTNFLGSSARKAGVMLLEQELCWVWLGRGGPTEQVGLGDVSAALSALPVPQQHWKCSCCSHSWLTLIFLLLWLFVTVHYYDTQKQPRSVIYNLLCWNPNSGLPKTNRCD